MFRLRHETRPEPSIIKGGPQEYFKLLILIKNVLYEKLTIKYTIYLLLHISCKNYSNNNKYLTVFVLDFHPLVKMSWRHACVQSILQMVSLVRLAEIELPE